MSGNWRVQAERPTLVTRILGALFLLILSLSSCAEEGSGTGAAKASGEPAGSTADAPSSAAAPEPPISSKGLGALLGGTPLAVYDRFEAPPMTVEDLRDRSAVTLVAALVGYELNPANDPAIYVPGYAGSSGVLRLLFEVETILGGHAPDAVEAPGHQGEGVIAVDTDYWIPADLQPEHFEKLAELDQRRFVLFLEGGAVANTSTGAYRIWVPPWGVLAESGGVLVRAEPDHELVMRRAVERGQALHPTTETTAESTPTTVEALRDLLTPLEGMTAEQFVSQYQVTFDARLQPPGPTVAD